MKKKIPKNELSVILGYYSQDGQHSAVTGGEGTEELSVKSSRVIYVRKVSSVSKWKYKAGIDQISSASTDKIDYIESSASSVDHRAQINIGYERSDTVSNSTYGFNIGSSIESDYWSRNIGFSFSKKLKKDIDWNSSFNFYWDDLRWGWVKLNQWKGSTLIYPVELRNVKWFEKEHRNSYSLSNSFTWNSSSRGKMGLMFDFVFQEGVLSTPFHRVYFEGLSLAKVENLPSLRFKLPIGFSFNYFLSRNLILKNYSRLYWDSYNIKSLTHKIEIPIRLRYWLWVKPFFRAYFQQGTSFFNPYASHIESATYYTSDYDFSDFNALNYGLSLKIRKGRLNKNTSSEVRLEQYRRSDGLDFWQSSLLIDFKF